MDRRQIDEYCRTNRRNSVGWIAIKWRGIGNTSHPHQALAMTNQRNGLVLAIIYKQLHIAIREIHQFKSKSIFIKQYITVIRVTLTILAITSDRAE
ncbi:hypothetical protein PLESHI_08274 [Plesiomonas shigelloides 302-73]|uniref:Uncharacterized protein n=1 Tax=Plesiomonas shigelloides 302-73 TaxID=1315976 RepID=R8ARE9_PLESH|nr:hypothetical protein PLESHI_08274 [Plesiomonas shigelloides 302-73]